MMLLSENLRLVVFVSFLGITARIIEYAAIDSTVGISLDLVLTLGA